MKAFALSFVIIALLLARLDVFGQERAEPPTFFEETFGNIESSSMASI